MNKIDELSVGQIVKSKAGRDKDRNFIVIKKVDCQYVLIADGDLRKVDNLKRKKVKHLLIYNLISEEVRKRVLNDDKITNLLLRKELEKLDLN